MSFLLGSFTDGLFGGARDAFSIANDWEELKQRRMETERQQKLLDASNQVGSALDKTSTATPSTGPVSVSAGNPGTSGSAGTSPGTGPGKSGGTLSNETILSRWRAGHPSNLSTVPTPNFMKGLPGVSDNQDFSAGAAGVTPPAAASSATANTPNNISRTTSALPLPSASAAIPPAAPTAAQYNAWKQYVNMTPSQRLQAQREGRPAPSNPYWDALPDSEKVRLQREGKADQVGWPAGQTSGAFGTGATATSPSSSTPLAAAPPSPDNPGLRAVRESANPNANSSAATPSALPVPRTTAPNYLPGNVTVSPTSPLINQAPTPAPQIGGTMFAPPALPTTAAPVGPQSQLQQPRPNPAMPSLAQGTSGLGAQILASLNPVYGSTA